MYSTSSTVNGVFLYCNLMSISKVVIAGKPTRFIFPELLLEMLADSIGTVLVD